MSAKTNKQNPAKFLQQEVIEGMIYLMRGQKVMIDYDLAALYGVDTKHGDGTPDLIEHMKKSRIISDHGIIYRSTRQKYRRLLPQPGRGKYPQGWTSWSP